MKARLFGLALVASAGLVCAGTPAFALSCSGGVIFAGPGSTTEGTNTYPGTNVGTVGCGVTDTGQIGNLAVYNSGSGGAYVNTSNNPVNYEFSFAGGSPLLITGKIGNNGIGDAIDMELLSWDGTTATLISSIQIPFSSGPSAFYTLYSDSDPILGAGNYIISTYLAVGNVVDPNFQINFALSQTPLPAALPLFASGLGAMGLLGWRKKRKAAVAA
jgi:hypothetical protein